jgi:hypothetical protein
VAGISFGKVEENRLLGRHRRKWEIILKWIQKVCDDVDWILLAQDRVQCRAYVNSTVINLGVYKMRGIS